MSKVQGGAAEALGDLEARDRETARRAADGRTGTAAAKLRIQHRERNLDEGLDETYPASDPVSIHPGSD